MVNTCNVCHLTIKPTPNFWVGGRNKAKPIELRFRCHMQPLGYSKCDKIYDTDGELQQADKEKN